MKFVSATLTLLVAAAPFVATASAHAQPSSWQFRTPSGNVGCQLGSNPDGVAYAWCRVDDHTWQPAESGYCPVGNVPGAIGRPNGADLQLSTGKAPCLGFVMSQMFFTGEYVPPTLDYGQEQSVGSITCVVERSGVKCTDSSTGHSFEAAREKYELS